MNCWSVSVEKKGGQTAGKPLRGFQNREFVWRELHVWPFLAASLEFGVLSQLRTDEKKYFLTQCLISLWNSLPQDATVRGLHGFRRISQINGGLRLPTGINHYIYLEIPFSRAGNL